MIPDTALLIWTTGFDPSWSLDEPGNPESAKVLSVSGLCTIKCLTHYVIVFDLKFSPVGA
jgi:hypothetical protein